MRKLLNVLRCVLVFFVLVNQSIISVSFLPSQVLSAQADRIQNNEDGYTTTDFRNNLGGVLQYSNINHSPSTPGSISASAPGAFIITSNSYPPNISGWNSYSIDYSGAAPTYTITDCSNNIIEGPMVYSGPVDLSSATYFGQTCLRSRVDFDPGTSIDNVTFSWNPLTVVLMDLEGSSSITAGDCSIYKVRRSISYYDNPNTAVYVQLPHYDGTTNIGYDLSTITNSYNQYPFSNIIAPLISDSGLRNSGNSSIVLPGGLEVPAHSVYRLPNTASLGSTHIYSFKLCSDKGTQNGTMFDLQAGIKGGNTSLQQSNIVTTTINSTPQAVPTCKTSPYVVVTNSNNKVGSAEKHIQKTAVTPLFLYKERLPNDIKIGILKPYLSFIV